MPWTCPSCGLQDNSDTELRCVCGYEYTVPEEINYRKIRGALLYLAWNILAIIIVNSYYVLKYINGNEIGAAGISAVLYTLFPALLLLLLFRKKRFFPKAMIAYLMITILLLAASNMIFRQLPKTDVNIKLINDSVDKLAIAIITGVIWIIYLIKSVRVKNTFVN